jgi:hypothetical protein
MEQMKWNTILKRMNIETERIETSSVALVNLNDKEDSAIICIAWDDSIVRIASREADAAASMS